MEESQPVASIHKISLLKRVLLYINVSAFRISKAIPTLSDYRRNYHARGAAVAIILATQFAILQFLFKDNYSEYFVWLVLALFAFHSIIDFVFMKDIIVMAGDYNAYYNKYLFVISIIFTVIGFCGWLVMLNNEIGHVK